MKHVGQISGGRSAGLVGRFTAGVRGAAAFLVLGAAATFGIATEPPSAGRPTASKKR